MLVGAGVCHGLHYFGTSMSTSYLLVLLFYTSSGLGKVESILI